MKRRNGHTPREYDHGTADRYQKNKCRCVPCTEAQRLSLAEYREQVGNERARKRRYDIQHGLAEPTSHDYGGYQQGCRCSICRPAGAGYRNKQQGVKR